jgi:hypothetical protein
MVACLESAQILQSQAGARNANHVDPKETRRL